MNISIVAGTVMVMRDNSAIFQGHLQRFDLSF